VLDARGESGWKPDLREVFATATALACGVCLCVLLVGIGGRHGDGEATAVQPAVNYALGENGAVVTGPRNSSKSAGMPPVVNDGKFDGYAWAYLKTPVLIRFAQPQVINTLEVYLHHEHTAWYRFYVEVSSDGETWQKVAEPSGPYPRGWQTLTFDPVQCQQVRITFTDTSIAAKSYHIVEIGAFMLADPSHPSPLRLAYDRWRSERRRWDEEVLLHFLGPEARMTAEELAAVLKLPEGQRITKDLDGDGDPDLADFVDTDPKHTVRPMVVRVLDDDDDMGPDGQGDTDSDCYVADWRGDGTINRAVDYWDEEGDGDLDRMDLYYEPGAWHGRDVEVVIIRDVGDDNRLWYTRNYEYQQGACQWQSDFNGDEMFCMFRYDRRAEQFLPQLEAPFTHHDLDGDGVAEMTIQFLGNGETIHSIRFSFDADNDSNPGTNRRDYDFSFNCRGRVPVPEEYSRTETLRNGEQTGRYLDWPYARRLCEEGEWRSCRLCWDEVDNNVNPFSKAERDHERWEGVGGYQMREGNKRWETDRDYTGKMALYYWPVDRRLHLFGAETGYINVDYDHDYRTDAVIRYADQDGDGFFDLWSYDADADGEPEHVIKRAGTCEFVPIKYDEFVKRYRRSVQEALDANHALTAQLREMLGEDTVPAVENWWLNERPRTYYAAEKLTRSAECRRYYQDLIREELFLTARDRFGEEAWWAEFEDKYEAR